MLLMFMMMLNPRVNLSRGTKIAGNESAIVIHGRLSFSKIDFDIGQ